MFEQAFLIVFGSLAAVIVVTFAVCCWARLKAAADGWENPYAAATTKVDARNLDASLDEALSAWPLPPDYAETFKSSDDFVVRYQDAAGVGGLGPSQRPLYRLMNAFHPHVAAQVRHDLLASVDYQQCLMHVFRHQTEAGLRTLCDKLRGSGHGPMRDVCAYVLERRLYGRPRTWDEPAGTSHSRWVYEAPTD